MWFVGGLRGCSVGAGARAQCAIQPSQQVNLGISHSRLLSGPELAEGRALAVEAPYLQRVWPNAEHVGGLLIGKKLH